MTLTLSVPMQCLVALACSNTWDSAQVLCSPFRTAIPFVVIYINTFLFRNAIHFGVIQYFYCYIIAITFEIIYTKLISNHNTFGIIYTILLISKRNTICRNIYTIHFISKHNTFLFRNAIHFGVI